ncbi:MAG TPA: hypothetical protein VH619_03175 [Verrucomicrobiae bacterium]|jgi:hypothetical protein|nr:hypothetical protein [Verrucomicrobiae bacterium]
MGFSRYLLFAIHQDNEYWEFEDYCVVPPGSDFSPKILASKPLDEKIDILVKRQIDQLDASGGGNSEEKKRLEQELEH